MTSLISLSLPVAATAAREVKQSQYKMAGYTNITLLDGTTNETYTIRVSLEDAERARDDLEFATKLLEEAVCNDVESHSVEKKDDNKKTFDNNKENEEDKNKEQQHNWSREETLLLLDLYTTKEKEFHSGKTTVKQCWENVSKEMKTMGYDISGPKCAIKFQAMKRTYKTIKDHNSKSGNNTKKWEYFDMMDKLFNTKPWVEPLAVAGTSVSHLDDPAELESSHDESPAAVRSGKRKMSTEHYLQELLTEKRLKRESDEKRHGQKMEQLQNIQTLLQNIINK